MKWTNGRGNTHDTTANKIKSNDIELTLVKRKHFVRDQRKKKLSLHNWAILFCLLVHFIFIQPSHVSTIRQFCCSCSCHFARCISFAVLNNDCPTKWNKNKNERTVFLCIVVAVKQLDCYFLTKEDRYL